MRPTIATLGPWVLLACSLNTIVTTIHHLHGARIFDTPERYEAVWIALAGLAATGAGYALASRHAGPVRERVGFWLFVAASLAVFVLTFGVVEGLGTHVAYPIWMRGYSKDEPFEWLFQATGVLHMAPALVTALLLKRLVAARSANV